MKKDDNVLEKGVNIFNFATRICTSVVRNLDLESFRAEMEEEERNKELTDLYLGPRQRKTVLGGGDDKKGGLGNCMFMAGIILNVREVFYICI